MNGSSPAQTVSAPTHAPDEQRPRIAPMIATLDAIGAILEGTKFAAPTSLTPEPLSQRLTGLGQ